MLGQLVYWALSRYLHTCLLSCNNKSSIFDGTSSSSYEFALCITNRVLHNGVHTMMGFSLLSTSELTLGLSAPATRVTTTRVYVSGIIGNYRLSGFSFDPRFVVTRLKSRCVTSVPGLPQFSSPGKQAACHSEFVCRTLRTLPTSSRFHRPVAFYSVTNTNLWRGLPFCLSPQVYACLPLFMLGQLVYWALSRYLHTCLLSCNNKSSIFDGTSSSSYELNQTSSGRTTACSSCPSCSLPDTSYLPPPWLPS